MEPLRLFQLEDEYFEKQDLAFKKFCSLRDFYQNFLIQGHIVTVNLMNLTCLESNQYVQSKFKEARRIIYDKRFEERNFLKFLREFSSLSFFLTFFPQYILMKFMNEEEKPDFEIRKLDKRIALEISSAVLTNNEIIIDKIIKQEFGRNKHANDIFDTIGRKYPKPSKSIGKYVLGNSAILSPTKSNIDCHKYKRLILEKVLLKSQKIKKCKNYAEKLILIDTENSPCFNEKHDAKELSNLFSAHDNDLQNITKIAIINITHKALMMYEVKSHNFAFIKKAR